MRAVSEPADASAGPSYRPDQMSQYFLDLERLLNRIDGAATHYQVLGVQRSADLQQIRHGFYSSVELMYPAYAISSAAPPQTLQRIERAFARASQAFTVLANFLRRKEYDAVLGFIAERQPDLPPAQPSNTGAAESTHKSSTAVKPQAAGRRIDTDHLTRSQQAFSESGASTPTNNRRRSERFKLSSPAQVTGFDRRTGKWQEMAETLDVSRTGLTLRLRRRVRNGMVIYLSLPMPTKMRSHGYAEPTYKVYGLVRRVGTSRDGVRVVGVEFLGQHPPAGFLNRPWAVFRAKAWSGAERRRERRQPLGETVRLEYLTDDMQTVMRHDCRTENVGRRGLRVVVKGAPMEFELIRVIHSRRNLEALASVRDRYVGPDGLERLCLEFNDREWPV